MTKFRSICQKVQGFCPFKSRMADPAFGLLLTHAKLVKRNVGSV